MTEIKSLPYVPMSHPFVERLIGTLRREYLDHMLFWTTVDLENKLLDFKTGCGLGRRGHWLDMLGGGEGEGQRKCYRIVITARQTHD